MKADPRLDSKASCVRRPLLKVLKLATKNGDKSIIKHIISALRALSDLQGL